MKKLSTMTAMLGLLLVTMFASGCASTAHMDAAKIADLGMPAPGKSKVVFLRPSHLAFAVHFAVHDGEKMIGRSSSAEYFTYECDPGQHVFSTSMENLAFLDADLLPDRIYYVKIQATMGFWIARVKMSALYPGCTEIKWEELPHILAKLEKTTITSEDVTNDLKGIKGYMERLKEYQDKPQKDPNAVKILPEYGQTTPLTPP